MTTLTDDAEKVRAALAEMGYPRAMVADAAIGPSVFVWDKARGIVVPDFVAWKALLLAGRQVCWWCHVEPDEFRSDGSCPHAPFTPEDIARMSLEARGGDAGFWRMVHDHAVVTHGGTETMILKGTAR